MSGISGNSNRVFIRSRVKNYVLIFSRAFIRYGRIPTRLAVGPTRKSKQSDGFDLDSRRKLLFLIINLIGNQFHQYFPVSPESRKQKLLRSRDYYADAETKCTFANVGIR